MVVERGGRGEGAWAELDGRQSNDVTITVGPGMVLPDVALQIERDRPHAQRAGPGHGPVAQALVVLES